MNYVSLKPPLPLTPPLYTPQKFLLLRGIFFIKIVMNILTSCVVYHLVDQLYTGITGISSATVSRLHVSYQKMF